MKYKTSNQSGFSLVETLVAITILLLVIVGPMTISATTARSTSFASEQVIASFLAQEGAELVQKIRDDELLGKFDNISNVSYPDPWDKVMNPTAGILRNCHGARGCTLDFTYFYNSAAVTSCDSTPANCDLYFNTNNPFLNAAPRIKYNHYKEPNALWGYKTPYSRFVKLTPVVGESNAIKVESTVEWRTGNRREVQSVKVETYLYNIYHDL